MQILLPVCTARRYKEVVVFQTGSAAAGGSFRVAKVRTLKALHHFTKLEDLIILLLA